MARTENDEELSMSDMGKIKIFRQATKDALVAYIEVLEKHSPTIMPHQASLCMGKSLASLLHADIRMGNIDGAKSAIAATAKAMNEIMKEIEAIDEEEDDDE